MTSQREREEKRAAKKVVKILRENRELVLLALGFFQHAETRHHQNGDVYIVHHATWGEVEHG